MKKLGLIRQKCQEAVDDYEELAEHNKTLGNVELEEGRAELAEEILEILNEGEK